ncbi:MAG: alpha-L-fucosidase [bacterium]
MNMKHLPPILAALAAATSAVVAADPPQLPLPTSHQADWLDAQIGVFIHWAPNVYQGSEGDNLSTPRERINPDRFNAAQIVQAAMSAKAGYIIFVAKHVGGYCAWQTDTTDYSLKTSPWKNGKGDMVAELAKACRDHGLRFGVYLSPRSDIHKVAGGGHAADADKQKDYNEIYRRQLSEILTNYGPMFEMWFDGGNIVPVNDLIEKLAPGIITFQGRRANSTRWVSNEHGFAPYPCWNTLDWKEGETPREGAGSPTGNIWCPAECDVSILRPNWFWSAGSENRILSLDDLVEIYYMSVGRGVNLLLNITPDDHGQVPEAQVLRLKEFGDEITTRFGKPLAATKGEGKSLELKLAAPATVDHFRLQEDIRLGERVRQCLVEGCREDGTWTTLWRGTQIGARQIVPIAPVTLTALRVKIEQSIGEPVLRELAAFHVKRPVPKAAGRQMASPQPPPLPNEGKEP